MKLPYSTNRIVDIIIRALQQGGFLNPGGSDANTIREAAAQLTEAEMVALVQSLTYGPAAVPKPPEDPIWKTIPITAGIGDSDFPAKTELDDNLGLGTAIGWNITADASNSVNVHLPIDVRTFRSGTKILGGRAKISGEGSNGRITIVGQGGYDEPPTDPVASISFGIPAIYSGAFPGFGVYSIEETTFATPYVIEDQWDYFVKLQSMPGSTGHYQVYSVQLLIEAV